MKSRSLTAIALLASVAGGAAAQQVPYGPPTVTPPYDSIVMTEPVAGSDIPVDIMLMETVDGLLTPVYSSSIGLLLWGARELSAGEPIRYESAPALGGLGRIRDALRSIFP